MPPPPPGSATPGATPPILPQSAPAGAPPPPPTAPDGGIDQPRPVQRTTGEKIGAVAGMLLPGIGTPIEQAIQDHYTNRVNQVKMYHQGATALGSALAAGPMGPDGKPTGIDPTTGQPMTPERKAQVQAQYEEAWTRYTEAAGVDKKTKDMLK